MTKFRGSIGSNQAPGIAVLRGFFLGEQAIAALDPLNPVSSQKAQPMDGEGQAGIRNAALVDQPAVGDSAWSRESEGLQDASADRLAWAAVWCMAAVAVAAFAMAVWR